METATKCCVPAKRRNEIRNSFPDPNGDFQLLTSVFYLYDGWNLLAEYSRGTGGWIDEASASPEGSESRAGDGDQLEAMKHEDPDEARCHTWGRDLSGSLQGAGGVGGLLAVTKDGRGEGNSSSLIPTSKFFLYDANGNVSQLLDESGEVVAAYTYDPFGNVTEMAGPEADENPWRFSTKAVDSATGWLYYGFRYYNPESGRWLNRDPIGEGLESLRFSRKSSTECH